MNQKSWGRVDWRVTCSDCCACIELDKAVNVLAGLEYRVFGVGISWYIGA